MRWDRNTAVALGGFGGRLSTLAHASASNPSGGGGGGGRGDDGGASGEPTQNLFGRARSGDHGTLHPLAAALRREALRLVGGDGRGHDIGVFHTVLEQQGDGAPPRLVQEARCRVCGATVRIDTAPPPGIGRIDGTATARSCGANRD